VYKVDRGIDVDGNLVKTQSFIFCYTLLETGVLTLNRMNLCYDDSVRRHTCIHQWTKEFFWVECWVLCIKNIISIWWCNQLYTHYSAGCFKLKCSFFVSLLHKKDSYSDLGFPSKVYLKEKNMSFGTYGQVYIVSDVSKWEQLFVGWVIRIRMKKFIWIRLKEYEFTPF